MTRLRHPLLAAALLFALVAAFPDLSRAGEYMSAPGEPILPPGAPRFLPGDPGPKDWQNLAREKARIEAQKERIEAFRGKLTLPKDAAADRKAAEALAVNRESLRKIGEDMRATESWCASERGRLDRLSSGLPIFRENMRRTEAMIEAARQERAEARGEQGKALVEALFKETMDYGKKVSNSAEALRIQVDRMPGMDAAKKEQLVRTVNEVVFAADDLSKAAAGAAGTTRELQKKTEGVLDKLQAVSTQFLVETGLADMAGEKLAEAAAENISKTWGPGGVYAYRGLRLAIDLGVAEGKVIISDTLRETAQGNLTTMRNQLWLVEARIDELRQRLAGQCRDVPPPSKN